jgi:radical SAM modification target selenobiotic family peptide
MDAKEMKKILAGVGIAGLLSGLPTGGGIAFGGSG